MFFEANTDFITTLDSVTLVKLMKRLMLAECRLAGVPLRGATAPLQVTVPDGGEDGRVEWTGGVDSTPYLPHNFCVFQSKAQNLTEGSIRGEILKAVKDRPPRINEAVSEVLSRGGAYIVFCSNAFTGKKKSKLVKAVKAAIVEGGGNPASAAAIEVYDANRIADWVNTHPSVALWLAALQRGRSLAGFVSHEGWGRSPDIWGVPWVASEIPRYRRHTRTIPGVDGKDVAWSYDQAAQACLDFLEQDHAAVRIAGPSGFGKSRFAYEMLKATSSLSNGAENASVIYADYSVVRDEVLKLALEIADSGSAAILIVDECPDDIHLKVAEFAGREESKLRIITLNVETQITQARNTLAIRLERADDVMVQAIAKSIVPELNESDTRFIAELSSGFPSMAVLAAQQNGDGRQTINSVEQVLDRVIWGRTARNDEAQKALESLSLFDWVGFKGEVAGQAAFIASALVGISLDRFVEHILSFESRGVVTKPGDFIQIGPIPLAARLGANRLSVLSADVLRRLFQNASTELKASLLKRMRWLDTSPTARAFAQAMLGKEGIGNLAALNTGFGAKCLDQLAHVDPDAATITIDRVFGDLGIDELKALKDGRRYLVWALEKLVFRKASFDRAATLLRRLAAAENEGGISNNASGQFKQLYQLYLCGTEAEPAARLLVLDDGLASLNAAEQEICVHALDKMLLSHHFSRGGGAEEIGSAQRLEDWSPKTYGEIWDFHRAGVTRLTNIALGGSPFATTAKESLGRHIRELIGGMPFDDVQAMINRIIGASGLWPEAIEQITFWLYFDSNDARAEFTKKVRAYFDEIRPDDPVDRAVLYTNGWSGDLHDPDSRYDPAPDAPHDFEYAAQQASELASVIAADPAITDRALDAFVCSNAKGVFAFARQLALSVANPLFLFESALEKSSAKSAPANRQFFSGMIAGADSRDPEIARACVRAALRSPTLKDHAISMIGSGLLRPDDLKLVVSLLQAKDVRAWQCAQLSYGKGLDHLSADEIMPLLDELRAHGAEGLWTVLDIVLMYQHGGKQPVPALINTLKNVLVAPELFDRVNLGTMDGHHFQESITLLARHGAINRAFAKAIMKQVVKLCQSQDSGIFHALDDPARKVLRVLIGSHPDEAWAEISRGLLSKDWRLRHWLGHLIDFDRDDYLGAGLLFDLPSDLYMNWARLDPAKRAAIIVTWLPVATKQQNGTLSWYPAMAAFIAEFGGQEGVLGALSVRLCPRSWWGSLGPYLEPLLPLLAQWQQHRKSEVRRWVSARIVHIKADLQRARQESEEDAVRYS